MNSYEREREHECCAYIQQIHQDTQGGWMNHLPVCKTYYIKNQNTWEINLLKTLDYEIVLDQYIQECTENHENIFFEKEKVLRYIPQDRQYTVNRLNSANEDDLQSYQPAFVETMSENGYLHLILLNIVE